MFDYDSYVFQNGSKVLEHVNSFTVCLKTKEQIQEKYEKLEKKKPSIRGRVYLQEAINFYENTITKKENNKSPIKEGDQFKQRKK